jgi:type III restriction enzyme
VEQLEKDEDMELETFNVGEDRLVIITIAPDSSKMDKDIAIPILSPVLARKKSLTEEIAALDVSSMDCPPLPMKENGTGDQTFCYEGYDIITLKKIIERDYTIPEAQTAQEVIAYYANRIAQEIKLPSQFSALVPKVREFLEIKAFGKQVNLEEAGMVKAISSNVVQYVTVKTFSKALREVVVEELAPSLLKRGRKLSETEPFPYSGLTYKATKTVFNLVPCDNEFERQFAKFLEKANDVVAFSKLPEQFGFAIEYTDSATNLRYYEPDFAVMLEDGTRCLVETKGREDIDVAHKDRAAEIWCENATFLTQTHWSYLKVPQKEFGKLQPGEFSDLMIFRHIN